MSEGGDPERGVGVSTTSSATPLASGRPTLRISGRSIAQAALVIGVFFLVATIAGRATGTLFWFVESAVFAALAWPLVQRLGRHMPKFVAVLVLTALVGGIVALLAFTGLMELRAESDRFRESVPRAVRELERADGVGTIVKDLSLAGDLSAYADEVSDRLRFKGADVTGLASKVGGSASAVLVVWILTVMLVFTGPAMIDAAMGLAPESRRDTMREVLRSAYGRSTRYMGSMALRSILVGLLTFTTAASLGLDMPGLLAAVAALLAFVPYVGIIAGSLPLAFMALINGSGEALGVLLGAMVLQTADAIIVQRRIDASGVPLGVFLTLVAAMLGFSLHGPGGMLVAVAIAALLTAVVNDTGAMQALRDAEAAGASPASASMGGTAAPAETNDFDDSGEVASPRASSVDPGSSA